MQLNPNQPSNLGYTPTERVWYPTNEYNNSQLYLNVPSNNDPTMGNSWTPTPPPPPKKRNTLKMVIVIVSGIVFLLGILTATVFISYNYGHSDGYSRGYNAGYTKGHSDGYDSGHAQGLTDGYTKGHSDGYDSGHAQGLTDGYQNGETNGYASGYSAGESYIECWVMQNHPYVYSWYFNNAFSGTTCP